MTKRWIIPSGKSINVAVENLPYVSIPAGRITSGAISHQRLSYRPHCDAYELTFWYRISFDEISEFADRIRGRQTLALLDGHAIDGADHIFGGQSVRFLFFDRDAAFEVASRLDVVPDVLEDGLLLRSEDRDEDLETLKMIADDPAEIQRFARDLGLEYAGSRDLVLSDHYCP
jgi:hypothetical protein